MRLIVFFLLMVASGCCGPTAQLEAFIERQALRAGRMVELAPEASREELERYCEVEAEAWSAALRSLRVGR